MKVLRFIILFTVIFFNDSQSMDNYDDERRDLDWSLIDACKNIENPATWSEASVAALRCSSVATRRLKDIKNKLDAGANPNQLMNGSHFTPFQWAVANNNPALVALLLKNRADAKIPFDRTKFVRPEPPITTLGLTLLNYLSIVYKEFNHTSLRHTEAVEVPLEKAHEDNLAIKKILIEAGIVAQGKKEVETATFAYERERAQHMRKPAAFY